jgi:AraC-like DNA-binding protein
LQLDGTDHQLEADRVYLTVPGAREYWQFAADKETHHSWCTVRPGFISKSLEQRLRRAPFSAPCSSLFHSLLESALKLHSPRRTSFRTLLEQLALCMFSEFIHAGDEVNSGADDDPALRKFFRYLEGHFGEGDCLKVALARSGVCRSYLFQKLREVMQTAPASYLWRFRVERGAAMLAETGQTAAEIAYRCGFKNPFHFSRLLKKQLGHSPREFRRQAWGKE